MTLTEEIRDAVGGSAWIVGERTCASTDGKGTGGARNVCALLMSHTSLVSLV